MSGANGWVDKEIGQLSKTFDWSIHAIQDDGYVSYHKPTLYRLLKSFVQNIIYSFAQWSNLVYPGPGNILCSSSSRPIIRCSSNFFPFSISELYLFDQRARQRFDDGTP